ncbi:hypothetical protein [Fusibacter sp. 3D3]|nr:hypothetical protein [Fusibacter sp. 3D3]
MSFENEHDGDFGRLIFKNVKAVKPNSLEDKVMQQPMMKMVVRRK